jgi:hypothetical protein
MLPLLFADAGKLGGTSPAGFRGGDTGPWTAGFAAYGAGDGGTDTFPLAGFGDGGGTGMCPDGFEDGGMATCVGGFWEGGTP